MVGMPHKLLLADDSVTIQRVIELTFADENVQVVAVGNGQEAIDRIQRDQPDIVLADVGMPERNGYEVAAFVKGNPATAHIPVVLLTGAFEPIDEGRARAAGCDGVLVKPFEPQIVIGRVKDLLAGNKPAGMWSAPPIAQGPVRQAPGDLDMRPATSPGSTDPLEAYFDQLDAAFASTSPSAAAGTDPFAGFAPPIGEPSPSAGTAKREPIPLTRPAAPAASDDPLMGWDPDLGHDAARQGSIEPPAPRPVPIAAAPPPPPPVAPPAPVVHAAPFAQPSPVAQPVPVVQVTAPVVQVTSSAPAAAPLAPAPAPLPASQVDAVTAQLVAEQKMGLVPSAASAPSASNGAAAVAPVTDEMLDAVTERVLQRLSADSRPAILDVAEKLVREEIERIKQAGS
jgi:CheY-like chemotaxis protein